MIKNKTGTIFDLQRFSVHDGPGIRTIVFFKGCPLRCEWCCNPESQHFKRQLMVLTENCIDCRLCEPVCPVGAISFTPGVTIDRDKCIDCGKCANVCFSGALTMTGKEMTVEELIRELRKDEIHYRKSNGGITLSGGEALAQPDFAAELLQACQREGWHTAIETAAFSSKEALEKVLPHLDLVLLDIKHANSVKHYKHIGQPNDLILKNAQIIANYPNVELSIRVPVIPKFNDTPEEIAEIAMIAKKLGDIKMVHLLPYHGYGANKYASLDNDYKMENMEPPSDKKMNILKELVEGMELSCKIGG
ncbi:MULTISPECIES: glycyl-radical enzyme activating protein [Clostridia]|uniref:glycyl-radical enzyme activating protein n=1 Tax=Clostridia TaxID=186801 RepID=UPI000EA38804|nr:MULTISPECIES: glycyl-radical enzyme activating protein [Clostridia]NBJ68046.1 glycyl-radical enzyme activating protein [Roseburia sp. 1XD42-34]RKI82487.1 glycyl-radical enzyme activating protein [Clostridium sp. 1xD42-85]